MNTLLSVLLILFSSEVFAKDLPQKFGVSQWYRFSAASDNRDHHQFNNVQGGAKSYPKSSTENGCQFFLFLCGLQGDKKQNVNQICDSAWKQYKPMPDVEGGGYNAATETGYHDDAKTLSRLVFIQGLEYASLKSFKVELRFGTDGKLDPKNSRIYFRELAGAKPSDDDSAYKFLDFDSKAAYFELGTKCK